MTIVFRKVVSLKLKVSTIFHHYVCLVMLPTVRRRYVAVRGVFLSSDFSSTPCLFAATHGHKDFPKQRRDPGYTRVCTRTPSKICNLRYESVKISQRVLLESWQSVGITSTVNRSSLYLCFFFPWSLVLLLVVVVVVVVVCLMAGRFTEHQGVSKEEQRLGVTPLLPTFLALR